MAMTRDTMLPYVIEHYMRFFRLNYFEAYKLATISIPHEPTRIRHHNCKSSITLYKVK